MNIYKRIDNEKITWLKRKRIGFRHDVHFDFYTFDKIKVFRYTKNVTQENLRPLL